jgi:hypothetical protein
MGLRSILKFDCGTCSFTKDAWTSRPNPTFDIGVVLGGISSGVGYEQLSKFSGMIGMHFMSRDTWFKIEEELPTNTDYRDTKVGYDMIWNQKKQRRTIVQCSFWCGHHSRVEIRINFTRRSKEQTLYDLRRC